MSVSERPVSWIFLTGFLLFLSLTFSVICLTRAIRFPRGKRFVCACVLLIAVSAPLTLSVEHYARLQNRPYELRRAVYTLVAAAPGLPLLLLAGALLLAACVVLFLFVRWASVQLSE